ncbi:MAG: peptidoglycan DD-metalloendopeptidase family protein [Deltaproteobacteria bacterium]|nr:peptidoglycan DD-metalloendopeptidase family protein [Deltaproteobacteria bacterium]
MKRSSRPVWMVLLFLWAALVTDVTAGLREMEGRIDSNKNTLEEVRRNISQKKKVLRRLAGKEQGLLARIEAIDRKLALKGEQLESYDIALKKVRTEKTQLGLEVSDLKAELGQYQNFLAYKVLQLYKYGGYSYVKAIFSAGNYAGMLKRYRYIQVLAREDKKSIDSYREVYAALKRKEAKLAEREKKVLSLENAFKEKNREIIAKREERTRLLARIRKEKASQKELLNELQSSARSLQQTIEELIRQKQTLAGGFEKYRGRLSWPLEGKVLTRFGKHKHEKFNTYIFSRGIDIAAVPGAKVKSIYNGTVLFADWFKGYGRMVILDHGKGFYSVYAHLSKLLVSVKEIVEEGQPVGRAGETGSLKGPALYFEIRYHGEPQDPLLWLAGR